MTRLERQLNQIQKTLLRELKEIDNPDITEFRKAYAEFDKCKDCNKYTILGKTCKGVCDKGD